MDVLSGGLGSCVGHAGLEDRCVGVLDWGLGRYPFVRAVSGRRSEGARSGVLPYLWLSYDDIWRKGGKRNRLGEGNEREETGTQVDPQTGELARGYTVLI